MYIQEINVKNGIPRSFLKTYSAFANTAGGVIQLHNCDSNTLNQVFDLLNNTGKVSSNVIGNSDIETTDGGLININVPKASMFDKPIYINNDLLNGTYKRNGDSNFKCKKYEIYSMIRDSSSKSADSTILNDYGIESLNQATIDRYREIFRYDNDCHVWNDLSDKQFLIRINALSREGYCTKAGLLMFGEMEAIKEAFPLYHLASNVLDEASYNIFDFYYNLSGLNETIKEAILNALINADYNENTCVSVMFKKDKLIVSNSGTLETELGSGISNPRNPLIMGMFRVLGAVDRVGCGYMKIIDGAKELGWGVEYNLTDRVILTIRFNIT